MKTGKGKFHTDGSKCVYGQKKTPKKYKPCCAMFNQCVTNCEYDIRFEYRLGFGQKKKTWGVIIPADGSMYPLNYCPFCGKKL